MKVHAWYPGFDVVQAAPLWGAACLCIPLGSVQVRRMLRPLANIRAERRLAAASATMHCVEAGMDTKRMRDAVMRKT